MQRQNKKEEHCLLITLTQLTCK